MFVSTLNTQQSSSKNETQSTFDYIHTHAQRNECVLWTLGNENACHIRRFKITSFAWFQIIASKVCMCKRNISIPCIYFMLLFMFIFTLFDQIKIWKQKEKKASRKKGRKKYLTQIYDEWVRGCGNIDFFTKKKITEIATKISNAEWLLSFSFFSAHIKCVRIFFCGNVFAHMCRFSYIINCCVMC